MIKKAMKDAVELFPKFARFYRNIRDLLDRNNPSIKSPWGFQLAGHPAMATGTFEPAETQLVRKLLQEVDILVNVGANVGYYCSHALSMGKPVIAVEPNTRNLHYLLKNIQNNGWLKLAEVFPVAIGSGTDILPMWGGGHRCISGQGVGSNPRELCHPSANIEFRPCSWQYLGRQECANIGRHRRRGIHDASRCKSNSNE